MKIHALVVGPFEANCYLVEGENRHALVIDPGADAAAIRSALQQRGLTVSAYLLTHGHMDHLSALSDLQAARPAPIGLHAADLAWAFEEVNQMPPYYPAPDRPGVIARELANDQRWQDAGLDYTVIATPGHTPGGVCFYFPAAQSLFTGDTLFAGSIGRTDLPGGDARAIERSLARLAALPEAVRIFPGHGPASTIAEEKRTNGFLLNLLG